VPKPMMRATQVNEFLKSAIRSELEKFNKFNSIIKEPLTKPIIKSLSRKNSLNDNQIISIAKKSNLNNKKIENIPPNPIKIGDNKLFVNINKDDSKDRSSSCEKKDSSMSTKRSTSCSSKKAQIDAIIMDNPSFVKLYDGITDERSKLIHYIKQCTRNY
jgi:hypothetical protein